MNPDGMLSVGVLSCLHALQRLIDGNPIVAQHVGLPHSKITAGVVSVEAGFDRGYLKKSRPAHLPILAKIEAARTSSVSSSISSTSSDVKRLKGKLRLLEDELATVLAQRDKVLTQNIQLWERIRELEFAHRNSNVHELMTLS